VNINKDKIEFEDNYSYMFFYSTHFNLFYNKSRWYESVVMHLISVSSKKYEKEVRSLVTNTARALKGNAKSLIIPLMKNKYSHNKQGLAYSRMVALLDILEDIGYVTIEKGGVVEYNAKGRAIKFKPSVTVMNESYIALWDNLKQGKVNLLEGIESVEIRERKTKVNKSTKGVKGIEEIRRVVDKQNEQLMHTKISLGEHTLPLLSYKRVFTEDITKGGRFYDTTGKLQTISSLVRPLIKIDDEPTVELDYSSLHASIAYELIGYKMPDGFKPYSLTNKSLIPIDENKVNSFRKEFNQPNYDPFRNVCKFALLCCFNSGSIEQAAGALGFEIGKERKSKWISGNRKDLENCWYYGIDGPISTKRICQELMDLNYRISDYFFEDVGVKFQMIDSKIAEIIMDKFLWENEICLPWHDSFVVKAHLEDMLRETMREAYKDVLKTDKNCKIDKKH
jgi:hypothetical protein